ncbi:dual specificity protein phosphatase family protein [Kaistia sp. MMO-174]|uniref:dual specificity protein phosphatase family protein n=1 Tax=Kaistia sp. MMO-174 TaxID=3081256 RepID=UPI003018D277
MTRKRILMIGGAVLAVPLFFGIYLSFLLITGNFHSVIAGELYRSAQPTPTALASYVQNFGIKTVINLRGANESAPWYRAEIDESRKLGVAHEDFRMSSRTELTQAEAEALIRLFKTAEKPILVHCTDGSDRTGLASALYVAAVAKLGEEAAEDQISFRYGHVALPLSPTWPMDMTFEALEPWLGFHDS